MQKVLAHGATDCVWFGAESWGVTKRAGEDVFFFCRRVRRGGGGDGRGWGRRRVREAVRKTCPSLHDPVQSHQQMSATKRCNVESMRRNENDLSNSRASNSNTSPGVWWIELFLARERIFLLKRNIILLSGADGAGCAVTLAATIPVLNYHKPLNPARTKLFLRSCPSEVAITRVYSFLILNVLFIFHVFVADGLLQLTLKTPRKASSSFSILGSRQTGVTEKVCYQ